MGAELQVKLKGPGWYWLDDVQNGIRVSQQVPFELDLSLRGRFQGGIDNGVVTLQFQPSVVPVAQLSSPAELEVDSVNAWGAVLKAVPGVSPAQRAAERFHREFSEALVAHLSAGATFTYALGAGQPDATLGHLLPGETPKRPFDETVWSVNDRLLLGPGAVQVLGPIKPGRRQLNVIVERGPGVGYRLICEAPLRDNFRAILDGGLDTVPAGAWYGRGTIAGYGEHTATLTVEGCNYFLVTTSLEARYTLADILVQS